MTRSKHDNYSSYNLSAISIADLLFFVRELETNPSTTYPVNSQLYRAMGYPPVLEKHLDKSNHMIYYIDCTSRKTILYILHNALLLGYQLSYQAQKNILDSMHEVLKQHVDGNLSAIESVIKFREVMLTSYYYFEQSSYLITVATGLKIDPAIHDERIKLFQDQLSVQFNNIPQDDAKIQKLREEYIETIKNLNNRIKQMEKTYHTELKEYITQLNQAAEQEREQQRERQELISLREYVFTLLQNKQEQELTDFSISFPYQTSKVIYVIGGHESWYKTIKNLLPTVRFIRDTNIRLNDKLVQADQVWFQCNAISHSQYYSASNITDRNNIPVYYFKYNSANSCAIQFVEMQDKIC